MVPALHGQNFFACNFPIQQFSLVKFYRRIREVWNLVVVNSDGMLYMLNKYAAQTRTQDHSNLRFLNAFRFKIFGGFVYFMNHDIKLHGRAKYKRRIKKLS